jgi:hypothetical protein
MHLSRSFVYGSMITLALTGCPGDDSTNDTGVGTTTDQPQTTTTGEPQTTTTGEPETTTTVDTATTGEPGTTTTGEPETTTSVDTATTGSLFVDFEMTLMGYPHDGQSVSLVIAEAGTMNQVGETGDTFAGGDLVLSIPGALQEGTSYDIYWYVDVNGNVACDAPPTDHSWELLGQAAGPTGLSLSHMHDGNWVDVCGNF